MEEAVEKMKKFSNEEYVQDYHAQEVLIRSQHNSEMKELEQNYKAQESQLNNELAKVRETYKEDKENVAKYLLKTSLTLEEISNATGFTIKELEKLKNEDKN